MKKNIDSLFTGGNRGQKFQDQHSKAFLKKYAADLTALFERGKLQPLPSHRKIAEYMTETHGEPVSYTTIAKHLNLLKKGQPLWQ